MSVEHADRRAPSSTAWRNASASAALSNPWPGSSSRWSTTSRRRPATRRRGHDRLADRDERVDGRRGREHAHRRARTPGALQRDVARVPRGRALVFERLVAFVEHDDRREIGHRCPHCSAAADHDARTGAGARPLRGADRVGVFGAQRDDLTAFVCASVSRASRHARPKGRSRASSPPAPAARRARRAARPARAARPCSGAPGYTADLDARRRRRRATTVGRRRRPQKLATGRPSATPPIGTGRPRRPAGPPTPPRAPRGGVRRLGLDDVGVEHPAAHPPAVQRHAHDRADHDAAPASRREARVVERAMDRGDVGLDPDDRVTSSGDAPRAAFFRPRRGRCAPR